MLFPASLTANRAPLYLLCSSKGLHHSLLQKIAQRKMFLRFRRCKPFHKICRIFFFGVLALSVVALKFLLSCFTNADCYSHELFVLASWTFFFRLWSFFCLRVFSCLKRKLSWSGCSCGFVSNSSHSWLKYLILCCLDRTL